MFDQMSQNEINEKGKVKKDERCRSTQGHVQNKKIEKQHR